MDLLSILRRRIILIATVVAVITTLSWVVASNLTPQYRSNTLILLNLQNAPVVNTGATLQEQPQDHTMIDTQMRVLRSRSFAQKLVEDLSLTEKAAFNPTLRSTTIAESGVITQIVDGVSDWTTRQLQAATDPGQDVPTPEEIRREAKPQDREMVRAMSILLSGLEVSQEGQSSVISVGYLSDDPELSAEMANKIASAYVRNQLSNKEEAADRAADWLKERVDELRARVIKSENSVANYRAENKLVKKSRLSFSDQQLANLSAELIKAEAKVNERKAKLDLLSSMNRKKDGAGSISEVMNSPVIGALRQEEHRLLREESQLLQEYGPRHPKIIEVQAQKENLTQKMKLELATIVGVFENELAIAESRHATLSAAMQEAVGRLNIRQQAEVQLNELERESEADRNLYTIFLGRYKALVEQRDLLDSGVRIISNAIVPTAPSFPQPKFVVAVGFTTSLMFGTLIALVRESLEQTLRSTKQIEQALGLSSYGTVPNLSGKKGTERLHHYLVEKPKSAYAEAIRNIWISLHLAFGENTPRVWLITSSLPNEGKTTLATSIATSLATGGQKTVLIDLDLRNPSVGKQLTTPPLTGLVEYLRGKDKFEDVIIKEGETDNLDIIPVCEIDPNPVDLLMSERLETLMRDLREAYDFVIIDSPPVLGISDTKLAARMAEMILLAVRWGQTDAHVARNAVEILGDVGVPIAGAVLTQVNLKRHSQLAYGDAAQYYKKYKQYYVD